MREFPRENNQMVQLDNNFPNKLCDRTTHNAWRLREEVKTDGSHS